MSKTSLVVFANFRINNEERYLRLKDSFFSFKDISAEKWVINIRGSYKEQTKFFLQEHLQDKFYHHDIESKKGWFHDTRTMLKDIDSDFVFFWIEDHINMVKVSKYDEILNEMKENHCDHLCYSWWHDAYKKRFSFLKAKETSNLNIYQMNKENINIMKKNFDQEFYIISAVSISSSRLFKKIILSNHPLLKRWSKKTPFDFEKKYTDISFLGFNAAVSKFELFAPIDDNHGGGPRYSLIGRDLYPNRMSRVEIMNLEFVIKKNQFTLIKKFLPKSILKFLIIIFIFFRSIWYTIN
jgi:hypothetical protein